MHGLGDGALGKPPTVAASLGLGNKVSPMNVLVQTFLFLTGIDSQEAYVRKLLNPTTDVAGEIERACFRVKLQKESKSPS